MRSLLLGLLGLTAACVMTESKPAVSPYTRLRADTRPGCEAWCQELGMRLGAIVLMHDSAGCVCEPGLGSNAPGAAAAAGGSVVFMAEEHARKEQARREEEERKRRQEEEAERQRRETEERLHRL